MPTKFHLSSNGTSRVSGGRSHEVVVEILGLVAGEGDVAGYGVPGDAGGARSGAEAAALADVPEDGDDLAGGQLGVLEGGALALGVGSLAGAAVDHADALVAAAVAAAAFAVVAAGGIMAGAVV